MSNELAKVEPKVPKVPVLTGNRGLQFSDIESMYRFCVAAVNSKQFGKEIDTPEVALIRLQAGLELGLTPIWSLTNIFVVNGRPTVYGDALLGIVRAHRDFADIRETLQGEGDDMVAICEIDRKGQSTTARRFSVKDAKRAGLWGKSGPWASYPMRMLQMRARAWACRDAFADALRGLGVSEEIRDIEPKPIQAREIERPKLILPDEEEQVPDYGNKNDKDQRKALRPLSKKETEPGIREQALTGLETENRKVVQNQAEPETQSASGGGGSSENRQDIEVDSLQPMPPTDRKQAPTRPSQQLQQEAGSDLAVPKVPQQFARDLVLAESDNKAGLATDEASESNVVGDLMPSEQSGVVEDSDGGQFPLDPKNEKGEFEF
jgi:hypothetical protein